MVLQAQSITDNSTHPTTIRQKRVTTQQTQKTENSSQTNHTDKKDKPALPAELKMSSRKGRKPGPKPAEVSQQALTDFLSYMVEYDIITVAARKANISYFTVREWRQKGIITEDDMQAAHEAHLDTLRLIAHEEAVIGVERLARGNGHLLTDEQGQPYTERQRNTRLLIKLLEAKVPELKPVQHTGQTINVNTLVTANTPDQYRIEFDYRYLASDEDRVLLKQIAERMTENMQAKGIVEGSIE